MKKANFTRTEVKGIGYIRFQNRDGTTFILHEVKYMPGIGKNLISVGTLDTKGCAFRGGNGVMRVVKGNLVFMTGHKKDSLYILQGTAKVSEENVVESSITGHINVVEDQTRLWHSRMGHISQKGLEVLAKKGCFDKDQIT